jgi:hypothetical protein
MANCMLLLQKYLDYRIKKGDCTLEFNPLNFDKERKSSDQSSGDFTMSKQTSVETMEEFANVDNADSVENANGDMIVKPDEPVLNEAMQFFCEISPGLKIIILKELCDWQLVEADAIHQVYNKHTQKIEDPLIFCVDSAGNRILHSGGNGMSRLLF